MPPDHYTETLFVIYVRAINEANIGEQKFNDDINKIKKYLMKFTLNPQKMDIKIDVKRRLFYIFIIVFCYGYDKNINQKNLKICLKMLHL